MTRVLIVAPHLDDETLGYSRERIAQGQAEIREVSSRNGMASLHCLEFPTTQLDILPMPELVGSMGRAFKDAAPNRVYLPFPGDVHSDHWQVFDAALACTKWFRYSSVTSDLAYETISGTEFGISPRASSFDPNCFVDISEFFDEKVSILRIYASELGLFPFPRSIEAVRARATFRGSRAGSATAGAFMVLKEV